MRKAKNNLKLSILALALIIVLMLSACEFPGIGTGGEQPDPTPDTEYYKVVFKLANGEPDITIVVEKDSTVARIADPVLEGYTFLGWFEDLALINKWDFVNDIVTSDIILYAGWEKNGEDTTPDPAPDTKEQHTIVFKLNNGEEDLSITVEHGDTIPKPNNPTRDGYTFMDWFTEEEFLVPWNFTSDKVTSNITLYAGWDKNEDPVMPPNTDKTYNITYIDAPFHKNPTTYTSADYILLQKASWNGLSFSHWTDKDGNVVTEIPEGTTGNLTLIANWKNTENLVVSNNTDEILLMIYNEDLNAYHFVYDLGTIRNVVLDQLTAYNYHGTTSHTWSISETVSFTESSAEEVAKTITNLVTSGSSWSSSVEAATNSSHSTNTTTGGSISAELGNNKGIVKIGGEVHNSKGKTQEVGSTNATSNSKSGSSSSSSESSKTVASTITFVEDISTQITHSETLDPTYSPAGMYKYVHAGTIAVFAIVTYDIETKNYYINIYSYIDEIYDTMLYQPTPEYNSDVNIVGSNPFSFDFNIEEIEENIIGKSYYIEYDANGGEGTMPTQMMLPNTSGVLYRNEFTKTGSTFVGWRVAGGDMSVIYSDSQSISGLGSPGETVTLEAVWTKDPEIDVVHTAITKTGYVSKGVSGSSPEIKYSVAIEYRNRTADSVEIKMTWTSTISKDWYTAYRQNYVFKIGSVSSGTVNVVPFNSWKNKVSYNRSLTGETGWVTVPLNTQDATTLDLTVYYWQENSGGTDMCKYYGYSGVYETWTINIPSYR